MPTWLVYGLTSSIFWGTYSIISKLVTSEKYLKVDSMHASLLMLSGISIAFLGYFLLRMPNLSAFMRFIAMGLMLAIFIFVLCALKQAGITISFSVISLGLLSGALWAIGMIFTFLAFSAGAEAAKLVPIYNTNTLIAVFLGLIFLHELPAPDARFKVIIGALLIVIGSILVSK
jgi:uncharacterized membrane protein